MFKKYPILWRMAGFIVLPLLLAVLSGYRYYFLDALPIIAGSAEVQGIKGKVKIARDEHGVVLIEAAHDSDVFFAMGYAQAQDRLWQLELQRRISQGRLSEIFGKKAVNQDIWFRTLGLYRAAEEALPYLSPEAKVSLHAYADGVNAFLASKQQLPVEFTVLKIDPQPWTILDTLTWQKMFAMNLASNYNNELSRFIAAQRLTTEQVQTFFKDFEGLSETNQSHLSKKTVGALDSLYSLQQSVEQDLHIGGRYVGSNAWVVSGDLTASGMPILSNDPHLSLQMPSLWYAVRQKGDKLDVSGMSLVGLPLVIFGKNQHIAWGGTSMMADVQDLYFEQVNAVEPSLYKHQNQWLAFDTRTEYINVKAEFPATLRTPLKPLKLEVRTSANGPVISDLLKDFEQSISMRWVGLDKDDTTYDAFLALSYATDWQDFKQALSAYVAPALNLVYADVDNNIGMMAVGRIPLRNKGEGTLPVEGGDSAYQWNGHIPFEQMPQQFNPPEGFVHNANNQNHGDDYPHFISHEFAPAYRDDRIKQLLAQLRDSGKKVTLQDMVEVQKDVKDISVLKLLERLKKVDGKGQQQQQMIAHLRLWDGQATRASVGATVFYTWLRQIKFSLFKDELEGDWTEQGKVSHVNAIIEAVLADKVDVLLSEQSPWCDDVLTETQESCDVIVQNALDATAEQLQRLVGNDVDSWQWGEVQNTVYAHQPFSANKIFRGLFERRISNGGADNTINVAGSYFDDTKGYEQKFGAGFRQIIELAPRQSKQWFLNSTGQSGQPASPYFDDVITPFRDVEYELFPQLEGLENVLTLTPKKDVQS